MSDWLDRLARRTAAAPARAPVAEVAPDDQEGLSRETAIKLAAATAVAGWAELHGASLADAKQCDCWPLIQDCRKPGFKVCDTRLKVRARNRRFMSDFAPGVKEIFIRNEYNRCLAHVIWECNDRTERCRRNCDRRPPKPPPPPPPENPPPPSNDLCTDCMRVGGKCCGPLSENGLCACANPGLPCSRYGCSG